ncbi:MAG: hypothetical protein QW778_03140 [Candidatus Micrarchaeaceae archaeon]
MNNQPLQKSLFWIITTLIITTEFVGGLMCGAILLLIFFTPLSALRMHPVVVNIMMHFFYLMSLIIGFRYALNFVRKKTEISEKEVKTIAISIGCFPFIFFFLIIFPWGIAIGAKSLSLILKEYKYVLALIIYPSILGPLSYYWLKKRATSLPIVRKKITKYEILALISLLVLNLIVVLSAKEGIKKGKDSMIIFYMEDIKDTLKGKESPYTNLNCESLVIKDYCEKIEFYRGLKPIFHSSLKEYCFYIELFSGEYLCIDASGIERYSKINPGNQGYCDGITFICPE